MKLIHTLFFLFLMTLNVAAPLVEQLRGIESVEVKEEKGNDADGEVKIEKEFEPQHCEPYEQIELRSSALSRFDKALLHNIELLRSESHATLPELPPEA